MKRHLRSLWIGLWALGALLFFVTASAFADEAESVHIVQPGEYLTLIASRYDVSIQKLIELNGIVDPNLIYVEQRLRMQGAKVSLQDAPPPPKFEPIISDKPWWGKVTVYYSPIRPSPREWGVISDAKRASLDLALFSGDRVQVVKTVVGQEVMPGNDKWYKIEAEEEQYIYSAYVEPFKIPNPPALSGTKEQGKWIAVYLWPQLVVAYEGDQVVYVTLTSSGSVAPTPMGRFAISGVWRPLYTRMIGGQEGTPSYYDLPGVRYNSFFTNQGHALHGTYWHHRFGEPMSHGCVNMTNRDAKFFYEWAPAGTPVVVN